MTEWISVNDCLPPERKQVRLYDPSDVTLRRGYLVHEGSVWMEAETKEIFPLNYVTHWIKDTKGTRTV